MSRTSLISEPRNDRMIIVKQWQIDCCFLLLLFLEEKICEFQFYKGNANTVAKCAAALLQYFIYWHGIKLEMSQKNKKLNDVAENRGDERKYDETVLQSHTLSGLEKDGLIGFFGKSIIQKAKQLLQDIGIVSVHQNPNPRYSYDRTNFYSLDVSFVQAMADIYSRHKDIFQTKESEENVLIMSKMFADDMVNVVAKFSNKNVDIEQANKEESLPFKAAANSGHTVSCSPAHGADVNGSAVALSFDEFIGSELTENQRKKISLEVYNYIGNAHPEIDQIVKVIEQSVLNKNQFIEASKSKLFLQKLNTVMSSWKKGIYNPHSEIIINKKSTQSRKLEELSTELSNLKVNLFDKKSRRDYSKEQHQSNQSDEYWKNTYRQDEFNYNQLLMKSRELKKEIKKLEKTYE